MAKAIVYSLTSNEVDFDLCDNSGAHIVSDNATFTLASQPASLADLQAAAAAPLIAIAAGHGLTLSASDILWQQLPEPTSYQTIVSQSGTSAPAVSGGLTPLSTYPSAVTFAWARTGTGVYTLTASSAVFNTSKTGVFVAPLQNLNGSIRAVVTSSTVITVTTAVQSLAVLGLLGFAATPTDALLSGTMIYVQTYA